jgi:metalloendopeptidase OMA1, mitochondrial
VLHDSSPHTASPLQRPLFRSLVGLLPVLLVSIAWLGCRSTPETGRQQLLILPESQEVAMGVTAYREVLAEEALSTNEHYVEMVERVGRNLAAVAGRDDYDWEFNVIRSPQRNAFALPGGKVAFYEGIIPVCQTEAGIAVVMSHEVAHALLRHGGERMSQSAVSTGLGKLVEYGSANREERDRKMIMGAYGTASKYGVMLPYSRKHESEADEVGLMLMAKAGYDPEEAPRFWERFAALKEGDAPPEFASTHPTDARRAADLRALLPKAVEFYARAPERHGSGRPVEFAGGPLPAAHSTLKPAAHEAP